MDIDSLRMCEQELLCTLLHHGRHLAWLDPNARPYQPASQPVPLEKAELVMAASASADRLMLDLLTRTSLPPPPKTEVLLTTMTTAALPTTPPPATRLPGFLPLSELATWQPPPLRLPEAILPPALAPRPPSPTPPLSPAAAAARPPSSPLPLAAPTEEASEQVSEADLDQRLRWQLDYYFSSENLRLDTFLMRMLGEKANAPMPIGVIAALPRVTALTEDLGRIVRVIRTMDMLRVSDDGRNVRRSVPLIDFRADSSTC